MKIRGELRLLAREIEMNGYEVRFVDWCEDAESPGLLGHYAGVTNWTRRTVKISTKVNTTKARMLKTLRHELRHVVDPSWDCGNRPVGLITAGHRV